MLDRLRSHSFSYQAPVLVCLLAILLLLVLPTGFEGALIYQEAERCTARVLETDNSAIIDTGLVRSGEQRCQLEILDGRFQEGRSPGSTCSTALWSRTSSSLPGTGPRWW